MEEITKLTLKVHRDSNGAEYVHQVVDESDKDHMEENVPNEPETLPKCKFWKGILCVLWPHSRDTHF